MHPIIKGLACNTKNYILNITNDQNSYSKKLTVAHYNFV